MVKADAAVLATLVHRLSKDQPAMQRECLDFLREHIPMERAQSRQAAGEAALLLWAEAESCLAQEHWESRYRECADQLCELAERLRTDDIPGPIRRTLLGNALLYINKTGQDDLLYEVLYATCRGNADLRHLAQRLEALGQDWPLEHARQIYRGLVDREKYLELRARKMEHGGDYYDLAMFYWEGGETDQALSVARKGLQKGQGRLEELRRFLAEQALKAGDREGYLDLQFQQAVDGVTVQSYRDFRHLCSEAEWHTYEPRLMTAFTRARPAERLKLHLLIGEPEKAIRILSSLPYPTSYDGSDELKAAAALEQQFPDQVLAFYRTGLGDVKSSHQRHEYAHQAQVLFKMRHVWVEIMGERGAWEKFARNIKLVNHRRPALQEEFGQVIPDWKSL